MALIAQQHVTKQGVMKRTLLQRGRWSRYSTKTFYLFIAPWLLGFFFLTVFPMAYALVVSFTNFDGMSEKWRFIGARNYVQIFHDPTTWLSIERTLIFTMIVVPAMIIGGLLLAILLNRPWKIIGFFRSVFYLPAVIPVVGSAIAWKLIFDRDAGAILSFVGTWGDWLTPSIFLNTDNTTLGVAMSGGYTDIHGDVLPNVLAAGILLYVLPVMIIFFFVQRYFVQGIVGSGLKG